MSKFCMSCGASNSNITDTCWRCGKTLNISGNQPYTGGGQHYPNGNQSYTGGSQFYSGGNQSYPDGAQSYSGGNQPYPGGNQNYYQYRINHTIWQKANSWKNNALALKYKVWGIVIFIFSVLNVIGLLYAYNELSKYSDWEFLLPSKTRQTMHMEVAIVTIIAILFIFVYIHSGILLLRREIKRKGTYIFYGVIYSFFAIISVWALFDGTGGDDNLLSSIFSILIYIITAIMMFSKISVGNMVSGFLNGRQ